MGGAKVLATLLPHERYLLFLETAWKIAKAAWRTIDGVDVLRDFFEVYSIC